MELKRTEDELSDMTSTLRSIQRRRIDWGTQCGPQSATTTTETVIGANDAPSSLSDYYSSVPSSADGEGADGAEDGPNSSLATVLEIIKLSGDGDDNGGADDDGNGDATAAAAVSPQELSTVLDSVRDRLSGVEGKVAKFRERLKKVRRNIVSIILYSSLFLRVYIFILHKSSTPYPNDVLSTDGPGDQSTTIWS